MDCRVGFLGLKSHAHQAQLKVVWVGRDGAERTESRARVSLDRRREPGEQERNEREKRKSTKVECTEAAVMRFKANCNVSSLSYLWWEPKQLIYGHYLLVWLGASE